jgi:hypothetical protein
MRGLRLGSTAAFDRLLGRQDIISWFDTVKSLVCADEFDLCKNGLAGVLLAFVLGQMQIPRVVTIMARNDERRYGITYTIV